MDNFTPYVIKSFKHDGHLIACGSPIGGFPKACSMKSIRAGHASVH